MTQRKLVMGQRSQEEGSHSTMWELPTHWKGAKALAVFEVQPFQFVRFGPLPSSTGVSFQAKCLRHHMSTSSHLQYAPTCEITSSGPGSVLH